MTDKKKAPEILIDFTKPFYVCIDQSPTRTITKVFQGDGARDQAIDHATTKARATGRHVAVLGPQQKVFAPPPPVTATEVELDFGNTEAG